MGYSPWDLEESDMTETTEHILTGYIVNTSYIAYEHISSVQFSCSVVSDSLRPHGLQHARPPCPSPTPGVHPNPCPLSQ